MKNKPLYLTLFPLLALGIAVSFPLQIYLIYDIPLTEFKRIMAMLTPLNLLTMLVMIIAAILSAIMSRYVYKVLPLLLMVTFLNNAIVGLYGSDYTLFQVALSFVLLAVSLKPFYATDIKAIIKNPQLRWWLTPTRYEVSLPLKIHTPDFEFHSETLNMSKTGIFAKIADKDYLESINIDEVLDLQICKDSPIVLKARVVRKIQDAAEQPNGFGLEFIKNSDHKKDYLPWLKEIAIP